MSIPSNLNAHFGRTLKAMASIQTNNANGTQTNWLICFAISKTHAFEGTITSAKPENNPKPFSLSTDRSLWLIPLTAEAKEQAAIAIGSASLPEVFVDTITLCNESSDKKKWQGYEYDHVSSAGPIIPCEGDSGLLRLSENGAWFSFRHNNDADSWPVWISHKAMQTTDRLISFRAPACRFTTYHGEYLQHEIWFGIENKSDPFVTVSTIEDKRQRFSPVKWKSGGREDFTLKPTGKPVFDLEVWMSYDPLSPTDKKDDNLDKIDIAFWGNFGVNIRQCFVSETREAKVFYHCTYFRSYAVIPQSGILFKIIGREDSLNSQNVRLIQICRTSVLTIFQMIRNFGEDEVDLWNKEMNKMAAGLAQISKSYPLGVVPQIKMPHSFDKNLFSEWSAAYGSKGYELIASKVDGTLKEPEGTLSLPLLRDDKWSSVSKDPSPLTFVVRKFEFNHSGGRVNDNGTLFMVSLYDIAVQKKGVVIRDGALAFHLEPEGEKKANDSEALSEDLAYQGTFRGILQLARRRQPFFLWQWYENIDEYDTITFSYSVHDFRIPVSKVDAAGQDLLAKEKLLAPATLGSVVEGMGERSTPPLIIPISNFQEVPSPATPGTNDSQQRRAPFYLAFDESINVGQNHRVDVKLLETSGTASNASSKIRAVVLDASPQIVGLVDASFLQQPGYDDGVWVLARKSQLSEENGGWELLDDEASTKGFKLVLPAQAIGEAYVKANANEPREGEPEECEPIEFRFAEPTVLTLAPERLERRYVAVPWNIRRILGQPGDAAPGIPLLKARFELLYGLRGKLQPEKSFIAEFAAKVGEFPVPPVNYIAWSPTEAQQKAFREAWTLYLNFYRAWQSRVGVLEPSGDDAFGTTSFSKGVSFHARVKSESTANGTVRTGAELRLPVPLKIENDEVSDIDEKITAVHDPDGLAGGFHYGFESDAIYRELWRELFGKGSSSGELKNLAFSSLGGWGRQTARFAGDKTIIKSLSAMGRTHFYAVERIGRIGVFWNKAKHVIEYERTVVPSEQFSGQPKHAGRPLVRKVREFIEILEPKRSYPDFTTDSPDAPGSILDCTFKSKIIPVLSSWGNDVWGYNDLRQIKGSKTTIGWQVPLWKPEADPQLYPKPQIQLSLLPPPDSDEAFIPVNLSEPQNLWFFTDTREEVITTDGQTVKITDNVHAWPAVKNVDFANLPIPKQYDIEASTGENPEGMQAPMPGVLDVLPGFERFTFRIDVAEFPAAVAGRYYPQSAISGRLRSASMMRSAPLTKDNWFDRKPRHVLNKLMYGNESLLAAWSNGFRDLNQALIAGRGPSIKEFEEVIKSRLDNTLGKTNLSCVSWVKKPNTKQTTIRKLWLKGDHFSYPTKWLWRESIEAADSTINYFIGHFDKQQQIFLQGLDNIIQQGTVNKDDIVNRVREFRARLATVKPELEFAISFVKKTEDQIIGSFDKVDAELQRTIERALDQVLSKLKEVEQTTTIVEIARTTITDDVRTRLTKLKKQIEKIKVNKWPKPARDAHEKILDTVTGAQDNFLNQLNANAATVKELVDRTIEWLRQNIGDFKKNLKVNAALLREILTTVLGDITNAIAQVKKYFSTEFDKILAKVDEEIKKTETGWTVINEAVRAEAKKITDNFRDSLRTNLSMVCVSVLHDGWKLGQDNDADNRYTIFSALSSLDDIVKATEHAVISNLIEFFGADEIDYDKWLGRMQSFKDLEDALKDDNLDATLKASVAFAESINRDLGALTGEVAQFVKDADNAVGAGEDLIQTGKQTLSNFRSVWEEFTAPGMGLNRRTVAMIVQTDWKQVEERLSLTPCISRIKQLEGQLDGLGLRQPVAAITDRLLPAAKEWGNQMTNAVLDKFNFSDVLSDIGGIRFDKLFPGFKMPESMRDKIKIKQGFDKQNLIAWANAEADIKLPGKKTLMSIGPILMHLENGAFTGKMRLELGIDGKIRKTNEGQLKGSWHMTVAGTPMMIFHDAGVIYKNDKLTFDLDPRRMEMPGLLKMITDATKTMSESGAGQSGPDGEQQQAFKITVLKVKEIPAGVLATLDIPPISVGGGTTAITNLCFGGFFMLSVLSDDMKFRFLLGVGFYAGKKDLPFNLTIFILGGGGFVDCSLYFEPQSGLTVRFVMSIHASAALAITLGWMTGTVIIAMGMEGEYNKVPEKKAGVYVSIYVHIIGTVDIMRLASIYLSMLLQATYKSLGNGGSELVGVGRVKVTIRLCRFVKIKVNRSYTKVFTRSEGDGSQQKQLNTESAFIASSDGDPYEVFAEQILSTLA